jgi:hypothetical protein
MAERLLEDFPLVDGDHPGGGLRGGLHRVRPAGNNEASGAQLAFRSGPAHGVDTSLFHPLFSAPHEGNQFAAACQKLLERTYRQTRWVSWWDRTTCCS